MKFIGNNHLHSQASIFKFSVGSLARMIEHIIVMVIYGHWAPALHDLGEPIFQLYFAAYSNAQD